MDYQVYLVDSQPLPNSGSRDYYEIRSNANELAVQLEVTPETHIIEWFVNASAQEFTQLMVDFTPKHCRTGAIVAKDTQDGTVLETTLSKIVNKDWFPKYCAFLDVDTTYQHQTVSWDCSPPQNSVIVTSHTTNMDLFTSLYHQTHPNPKSLNHLRKHITTILDSTPTA